MKASDLFLVLETWVEAGWIRRLDVAFARFVHELSPESDSVVLLAVTLLAHLEGRGHSCLNLETFSYSNRWSGLSGELAQSLASIMARLPPVQDTWAKILRSCRAVYVVDGNVDCGQPLVLSGQRLYLRRYWRFERQLAAHICRRTDLGADASSGVDLETARDWLDRLFPVPMNGPDWQKIACAIALRGRFSVITGGPGTGKTYTAARLLALLLAMSLEPDNLRVVLAAPTGKAAARLKQSIDTALEALSAQVGETLPLAMLTSRIGPARTLHGLLGARPDTRKLRHHAGNPLDVDVLIVDEASMVHLEMMVNLLEAIPPKTRLILLGDKEQLASVEAGAVLGDLCSNAELGGYRSDTLADLYKATGVVLPGIYANPNGVGLAQHVVMLRESRRFGGTIGQLALAVNAGSTQEVSKILSSTEVDVVRWIAHANPQVVVDLAVQGRPTSTGIAGGYADYLRIVRAYPATEDEHVSWVLSVMKAFDSFRVLCAVREGSWGVREINQAIQTKLAQNGLLSVTAEWYEGRPVIVTRNNHDLGVFNGDIGVTLRSASGNSTLRVYFVNGAEVKSVSISRLVDVETAFAMTVHKSQGSEFDHTALVLPVAGGGVVRELIYTGITRARKALTLITEYPSALEDGIKRITQRSSGLQVWIEQGIVNGQ
jgi:exodeoxyribonuclease V alpha subunit